MVIIASQMLILLIHKIVRKILRQQDLFSTMTATTISSNLTSRRKIHRSNSILICKHNNIKRLSITSSSINNRICLKKLWIRNLSQKLKKTMTCSTISNRLLSKPSLHPKYSRKLSQQWMLNLCFQVNQIKRMEAVRHKTPAAILLKAQPSKHQVNSSSNSLMKNLRQRHKLERIWEAQQCLLLISLISFPSSPKFSNRFPHQHSKKDQYNNLQWALLRTVLNSILVNLYKLNPRSRSLNHKVQFLTTSSNLETMVKILVEKKLIQTQAHSLAESLQHR